MDTQALLDRACPIITDKGATFFYAPETEARAARLGLDIFSFYVIGRGGVLGDADPDVVASAFGFFKPEVVRILWNGAREHVEPREAGRQFLEAVADHGRLKLTGAPGLAGFINGAQRVVDAAKRAESALVLFSGIAAETLAEDPPALAAQLLAILREFRGSAHLVAVVASGVDPKVAHYERRPERFAFFGWDENDIPEVTDTDRARLAEAEALTDRLVMPAYGVLDEESRQVFLEGLDAIAAALDAPEAED
jgi:hypothetical protein